jgi:hypothetical protein
MRYEICGWGGSNCDAKSTGVRENRKEEEDEEECSVTLTCETVKDQNWQEESKKEEPEKVTEKKEPEEESEKKEPEKESEKKEPEKEHRNGIAKFI